MKILASLLIGTSLTVAYDSHNAMLLFETSKAISISQSLQKYLNTFKVEEKIKANERALHAFPSEGSLMTKLILMELAGKDTIKEKKRFKILYGKEIQIEYATK